MTDGKTKQSVRGLGGPEAIMALFLDGSGLSNGFRFPHVRPVSDLVRAGRTGARMIHSVGREDPHIPFGDERTTVLAFGHYRVFQLN